MILRILFSLPLWLAYTATSIALNLVGLVILLPLSFGHLWDVRRSLVYGPQFRKSNMVTAWKGGWLTWLWGNEEDGVTGPYWWATRNKDRSYYWATYRWSALRNPSNNMRFIPGINPVIDPDRIRYYFKTRGAFDVTYTYQGVFSGLLVLIYTPKGVFRFWWGWKLKPEDRGGVSPDDMRAPRCGFGTQLKRVG